MDRKADLSLSIMDLFHTFLRGHAGDPFISAGFFLLHKLREKWSAGYPNPALNQDHSTLNRGLGKTIPRFNA